MSVWSMETVRAVGRLRVSGFESREAYEQIDTPATGSSVTYANMLHDRLAREIVEGARTHAVEVDPRDTVMTEVEAPGWMRRFDARWQPRTETVEVVGGPMDGSVLAVKDAPDVFFQALMQDAPLDDLCVTTRTVTYECVGWSEAHRRWVYGVRA